MELSQQIKNYFFEHLNELTLDKRFHFASRLSAWEGEARTYHLLIELKDYMIPPNKPLEAVVEELLEKQPHKGINAFEARKAFFDKYKGLYGIHTALFRIRHLKTVYGVDALPILVNKVGRNRLDKLADQLLADPAALKILSTYAINYLYLYKLILLGEKDYIDLKSITDLKDGYDLADPKQIQLLIYLYTHCVIGASNFYTQALPSTQRDDYINMIKILEPLIRERFEDINLDNKLEYLVCARICGIDTDLFEKIHKECSQSLSPDGYFLIDTHNKNAQQNLISLNKSEHRNVLFIMSCSPYEPHDTLVQN